MITQAPVSCFLIDLAPVKHHFAGQAAVNYLPLGFVPSIIFLCKDAGVAEPFLPEHQK